MSKNEVDYKRALSLLKRINTIRIHGKDIQEYFTYEGYNFWQAYQTEIFVLTKRFTIDPKATVEEVKKNQELSFLTACTLWCISSISFVLLRLRTHIPIFVFSVDKTPRGTHRCDFRLEELYQALVVTDTPYAEMLYSPSASAVIKNMWKRHRIALYTGGADITAWRTVQAVRKNTNRLSAQYVPDTVLFTEVELAFVVELLTMLESYFVRVPVRVAWMEKVLTQLGVRYVYLIDDMWHCFEILCASARCKIPSIAIQHGHFTKYHVGVLPCARSHHGTTIKPERLYIWTDYWKQELARIGSFYEPNDLVVAGIKNGSMTADHFLHTKTEGAEIGLLIPYETDVPKERIQGYLNAIKKHTDVRIYFKPRPDLDLETQLVQYGLADDTQVTICPTVSMYEDRIHVALGTYTTFLYDMIGRGIFVIVAIDILDYGEGMLQRGIASAVTSSENLYATIIETIQLGVTELEKRKHILYGTETTLLYETLVKDIENKLDTHHV